MVNSLYIHIPFCDAICSYCDFAKVFSNAFSHRDYLDRLILEIEENHIQDHSLKTIYIGGGTPSALSIDELEYLLSYLDRRFYPLEEFTLEANPESLIKDKILLCQKYHVNRISLGVQSTNDTILKSLGRNHTLLDVRRCINDLHEANFDNFNLDFIYGLPEMTKEDLLADIEFSKEAKSKHLSYYSLQIEEGTLLYNQGKKGACEEEMREMYDFLRKKLAFLGYNRYEVSNFALPGYESKHNLTYWHDELYYAVGVSASSYLNNTRKTNTRSLSKYLKGDYSPVFDIVDKQSEEVEFLMLNLRLSQGFSLRDFKRRFDKDFVSAYQSEIAKVNDYVLLTSTSFKIKDDYLYTMDNILLNLIKE